MSERLENEGLVPSYAGPDPAGRVMVVTGTRKGIGHYLAEHWLAAGWTVVGWFVAMRISSPRRSYRHSAHRFA